MKTIIQPHHWSGNAKCKIRDFENFNIRGNTMPPTLKSPDAPLMIISGAILLSPSKSLLVHLHVTLQISVQPERFPAF